MLSASGLEYDIADRKLLAGADLEVGAGEVLAIVGPSGSGKTTLLQILAGIRVPSAGRVCVDGENLLARSVDDRARVRLSKMGFVFQFGELLPELTVRENVALPLRLNGSRRRAANDAADDLLARLGLEMHAGGSPLTLSGGESQRVAVARALVHEPLVVLADEPTGSLDRSNAKAICALLMDTARQAAAAVVMVTHNLEIAAMADGVMELADGLLIPSELA